MCGKNYGSKWKTYDHLNKSHGRIFRACKSCLEVFDTELDLQAHCSAAHVGSSQGRNGVQSSLASGCEDVQTVVKQEDDYDSDMDEKNGSSSEYSNDAECEVDVRVKTAASDSDEIRQMCDLLPFAVEVCFIVLFNFFGIDGAVL